MMLRSSAWLIYPASEIGWPLYSGTIGCSDFRSPKTNTTVGTDGGRLAS